MRANRHFLSNVESLLSMHSPLAKAVILTLTVAFDLMMVFACLPVLADPTPHPPLMPVCGDKDGSESPFVIKCQKFVSLVDRQLFQIPGTGSVSLRFDFVFDGAAVLKNELGVFRVDDISGSIDGQKLGDPGYLTAAFNRARILFSSGSTPYSSDVTLNFNGGDILVFFIVQDQTLVNLLTNNPTNDLSKRPLAFFSLDFLNPDGRDHFVAFEDKAENLSQVGFEDLTGGGDFNYQDVVCNVSFGSKLIPPV